MKQLKEKSSVKFFGVTLDEKLSWRIHTRTIENKISEIYQVIMSRETASRPNTS